MKSKYIIAIIIGVILLLVVILSFKTTNNQVTNEQVQPDSILLNNRSILTLETEDHIIEITVCEEGNVSCNDLVYRGINKETKESITIQKGRTVSTLCADGVTPCRFIGYEFINEGYTYFVNDTGELVVTDPEGQIILEEEGMWDWENEEYNELPRDEESVDNINLETFSVLEILNSVHYISIDDTGDSDVETFLYFELQEALNDKAKLERLESKISVLQTSSNEVISLSGLVLHNFVTSLKNSYDSWIQYLRGININTVEINEYQYQYAKLHSDWKTASLDLFEGMSFLPYVALEFDSDGESSSFNEDIRLPMLTRIDQLFEDILIEDEQFNKETGDNRVIPLIIESYIEVLTLETQ